LAALVRLWGIRCASRTASAKAEARQCDNGASLALSRAALVSKQPSVACYGLAMPHLCEQQPTVAFSARALAKLKLGRIGSTWGHYWRYRDAAFVNIQPPAALIRAAHWPS
jgi:hypothetical protein